MVSYGIDYLKPMIGFNWCIGVVHHELSQTEPDSFDSASLIKWAVIDRLSVQLNAQKEESLALKRIIEMYEKQRDEEGKRS